MSANSLFFRFRRDERGAIGVFFVLSLPFMLLIGAIAVDIGYLWSMQAQLQATADAAALAGASKIDSGGEAKSLAISYAKKNMPVGEYGEVVTGGSIILGAWDPKNGTFSEGGASQNAIKVTAKMTAAGGNPAKLFFAQAVGLKAADVVASSIAYVEAAGGFCILGLDPAQAKTVEFRGNALVDTKCGVASNSSAGDSVAVVGSATLNTPAVTAAGKVDVQGAATLNSGITVTDAGAMADPYATLDVPTFFGCDFESHTAKNTVTLSPGVYCGGLTINAKAKVTLQPGVYIIDKGELRINGGAAVSGEDVTFILTSSSGAEYSTLTLNGGAEISLAAPTEGDLAGILFYQDRKAPEDGSNKINGGAEIEFKGLLYFPSQELEFTGGAEADNGCTHLVARKITVAGNADLENACEDTGVKPLGGKAISLVG